MAATVGNGVIAAVLLAIAAAVTNATASVLQRKAARREPDRGALSPAILWDLAKQPAWLGGIATTLLGFGFQVAALSNGPILLVQPIMVVELGCTLLLSTTASRSRLHAREWTAVAGLSTGLALLLVALAPSGGDPRQTTGWAWVLGCAVTAMVVALLILLGHRSGGGRRAGYLGLAAGSWFGFTAVLVAAITAEWSAGLGTLAGAWQLYALPFVGPAGFFLLQNALRAGRLVASQPGLTLANPVVATGWGVAVFGEHVRTGGWIALQVLAIGAIFTCTVLLSQSPLLRDEHTSRKSTVDMAR